MKRLLLWRRPSGGGGGGPHSGSAPPDAPGESAVAAVSDEAVSGEPLDDGGRAACMAKLRARRRRHRRSDQGRALGAGGGRGRLLLPPHRGHGQAGRKCGGSPVLRGRTAGAACRGRGSGLAAEPVRWPRARHRHLRKPRVSPAAPLSEEARRQKRSLPLPPPPPPIVHRRTEGTEPTALSPPPPPSPGTGNHRRPCRRGQHRGSYPARRAPAPLLPDPSETAGSAGRGRVRPARHGRPSRQRAALPALLCIENVPAAMAASPLPQGAEPG